MFIAGVLIVPQLISCGKDATTSIGSDNGYLNLVNLSPNINPVNLYASFIRQSTTSYRYPNASGYFLMNINDTPLQVRQAITSGSNQTNLVTLAGSLKKNVRYTWFLTGLKSDSAFSYIFTVDSGATPGINRAKVRLVNASPGSTGINITANDSSLFSNVAYKGVSDYKEVTSGTYNFRFSVSGAAATTIYTLPNTTVLDGKLYTIYAYGLPNRTDTAKFAAGIILNTIPDKK
ncbi:hypothetical protein BC343_21210 [Mucilaginibacter pedocola]|uniref:DUF4397 domain-containing protein n=2 Tax=Mucilaginibacter pedocola TaxID=1792845 RepID=A0A1S9PJ56_9SPHI|nr:hypothetical protein BC343_21210 [Mucilaginibacter pedocola]